VGTIPTLFFRARSVLPLLQLPERPIRVAGFARTDATLIPYNVVDLGCGVDIASLGMGAGEVEQSICFVGSAANDAANEIFHGSHVQWPFTVDPAENAAFALGDDYGRQPGPDFELSDPPDIVDANDSHRDAASREVSEIRRGQHRRPLQLVW
jgi:hypothetical protein